MKVAVFSTKTHDRAFLDDANTDGEHDFLYLEPRLTPETAPMANGYDAVCAFVNDHLDRAVLDVLASGGTRLIALRSAGFNNVDLEAATELGMTVVRVPAYSPHSIAEHTVGLMLALNRNLHRASARVREWNFSLEGLMGFDMHGKTIGIVGTGKIGAEVAKIMQGFGCNVIAFDPYPNPDLQLRGVEYVALNDVLHQSDIVTLHVPLTKETHHLIDDDQIARMKKGVMVINTSRGGLLDTQAVIRGLKSGQIGYLGLDVYEEEDELFFEDLSSSILQDDTFARLLTFPNVLITGHQAFFTREAVLAIAETTVENISTIERGKASPNVVG